MGASLAEALEILEQRKLTFHRGAPWQQDGEYHKVIRRKKRGELNEIELLMNKPPEHPGDSCAYCGKKLSVFRETLNNVLEGEHRWEGVSTTEIYYTGKIRVRGYEGIFCTYECGCKFGKASYRAGYRMVGK